MLRDALDAADFAEVLEGSERVARLVVDGERLLPDFGALVEDLFCGLVKLNVVMAPSRGLPARARLRAAIVQEVAASEAFATARLQTRLSPRAAGFAVLALGRALLERLRRGELLSGRELGAAFALARAEADAEDARARMAAADALARARPEAREAVARAREEAEADAEEAAAAAAAAAEVVDAGVEGIPREVWANLSDVAARAAGRLEELEGAPGAGSAEVTPGGDGGGQDVDALALQAELRELPGMKQLVKLLGALREEARAARRQRVPRARTEVYGIDRGRDLERLLPAELAQLGHPLLRLDFRRRLVEDALLVYHLRGDDELGQGPAIFLLDVSGSMAGTKVTWAKAVVLALADIARRQRRRVTVICFTSGASRTRFDLAVPRRGSPALRFEPTEFMGLARMGTGGGTDFWPPLVDALDIIAGEGVFARADIVLVTDGEANLTDGQVAEARARAGQRETRFLGLLIDVADHEAATVERLCDTTIRVGELTASSARRVFKAF